MNILFTKTNLQAPIAEVLNLTEIKILLCIHAKSKFTYYQEKILQGDQSKDLVESTCERFQLLKMSALLCAVAFDWEFLMVPGCRRCTKLSKTPAVPEPPPKNTLTRVKKCI